MFWLIRKLVFWSLLIWGVVWLLNKPFEGRPLKDYLKEFIRAPIVQEGIDFTRQMIREQFDKGTPQKGVDKPMETISEKERKDLESILKKESR